MHYLEEVAKQVDQTHPHLGNLVAFSMVAAKAHMTLIVVCPAGCGKSAASNFLASAYPDARKLDSVTRSGLDALQKEFSYYRGLVVIDDMGKIDTPYSRMATITTFAELCYSHFVEKHTVQTHLRIENFFGSSILNCQPVILRRIVEGSEWEATIQDKTIRYYHLYRPLEANQDAITIKLDWGLDIDGVKMTNLSIDDYKPLNNAGLVQWSTARVKEHIGNLLKAAASLAKRSKVTSEDAKVLYKLMQPMRVESEVLTKTNFEEGRSLLSNVLALLTEFATYREFGYEELQRAYKISEHTAYRLMELNHRSWVLANPEPRLFAPSKEMEKLLKKGGVL